MTTTTAWGGILIKKLYIDFLEAYNGDEPENYFPCIHLFPGCVCVCEFFPGKMILLKLITVCVCLLVSPGATVMCILSQITSTKTVVVNFNLSALCLQYSSGFYYSASLHELFGMNIPNVTEFCSSALHHIGLWFKRGSRKNARKFFLSQDGKLCG